MTIEEAKKMLGVEFTYIFPSGDTIKAYVKAFDPEVGFSCYSLETESLNGWAPEPWVVDKEEDGTFCIVSIDAGNLNAILEDLQEIKETGKLVAHRFGAGVGPICNFS